MDFGVYLHFSSSGECIYVGMTSNFIDRTRCHKFCSPWKNEIAKIEFIQCENEMDARSFEKEQIREIKPKYNKRFANLPTDQQLDDLHFVFTRQNFYDSVKRFFGFDDDDQIAKFFFVSKNHIKMVRLGIVATTWQEQKHVMDLLFCNTIHEMKQLVERRI